jgi:hypothetical protein
MKKLIILFLMVLLVSGVAFAQVKVSGQIEYETASSLHGSNENTSPGAGTSNSQKDYGAYDADVRLQLTITADDYNTGTLRFRYRTNAPAGDVANTALDRAFLTTDIGKYFKLSDYKLGWKSEAGLNEYTITPNGNGKWNTLYRVLQRESGDGAYADYFFDERIWGTRQAITIADMLTLTGFFALEGVSGTADADPQHSNARGRRAGKLHDFYTDAKFSFKEAGPGTLSLEVAYLLWSHANIHGLQSFTGKPAMPANNELDLDQGTFLFALGYTGVKAGDKAVVDFGAAYYKALDDEIAYDIYAANLTATIDKNYYILAGLQGYPKNDKIGTAGYATDKAQLLHNVRVAVGAKPVEAFGIDVGALFYTGGEEKKLNDASADRGKLNTFDASGVLYVGKGSFRLGYIYVPENDITINPFNTDALYSSLYFKARLDL